MWEAEEKYLTELQSLPIDEDAIRTHACNASTTRPPRLTHFKRNFLTKFVFPRVLYI